MDTVNVRKTVKKYIVCNDDEDFIYFIWYIQVVICPSSTCMNVRCSLYSLDKE